MPPFPEETQAFLPAVKFWGAALQTFREGAFLILAILLQD